MEICRIEVKSELTGEEALPQQPFGSMYYLQRFNWLEPDWASPGWAALQGSAEAANGSKLFEKYMAREGGAAASAPAPAALYGDSGVARSARLDTVSGMFSEDGGVRRLFS